MTTERGVQYARTNAMITHSTRSLAAVDYPILSSAGSYYPNLLHRKLDPDLN